MEQFAGFELLGELARGGMGVVYRARDPGLRREVAIKVLLADAVDPSELERFRTEGVAGARLRHPGIVGVHGIGLAGTRPFLVMDLIPGESLAQRLKRTGPLAPRAAAELIRQAALALDYAHGEGVLHRDLKPENLLLDERDRPVIADFGVAKLLGRDTRLTLTGELLGTPLYMPPEQAHGEPARIGPACDVYSLGATLYAALCGNPPFRGRNAMEALLAVVEQRPEPPSRQAPGLDAELEAICLRCLEKQPEDRYPSAGALAAALAAFLGEGPPGEAAPRAHRGPGWALLAAALTLAGLALGWAWRSTRAELHEARAALREEEAALRRLREELPAADPGRPAGADPAAQLEDARTRAEARATALGEELSELRQELERARVALEAERTDRREQAARAYARALELQGAERLKALDRALDLDPAHRLARRTRAAQLLSGNEPDRALADCAVVLAQDPQDTVALWTRALCLQNLGRGDLAGLDLDRLLTQQPEHDHGRRLRARLRWAQGAVEAAFQDLDRLIAAQPDLAELHRWKAGWLFSLDDPRVSAACVEEVDRALALGPESALLRVYRARAQQIFERTQGAAADYTGSRADYDRALQLEPGRREALAGRAEVRFALGELEGALADCEGALASYPPSEPAHEAMRQLRARIKARLADRR